MRRALSLHALLTPYISLETVDTAIAKSSLATAGMAVTAGMPSTAGTSTAVGKPVTVEHKKQKGCPQQ